jgi:hypothetical protein
MKFDLSQHSGAKLAVIVILLYAIIAAVTYFAWSH